MPKKSKSKSQQKSERKKATGFIRRTIQSAIVAAAMRPLYSAVSTLATVDIKATLRRAAHQLKTGITHQETEQTDSATIQRVIEDGVERVIYQPYDRQHETPIVFQHGMWAGAWIWGFWQEFFAAWGWQSVAFSLPGHGGSAIQRPIEDCTLDYYTAFLKAEIERLERPPVLIGHSMGGGIAQWYLKYVADDLPALVLMAPLPHQFALLDVLPRELVNHPLALLMSWFKLETTPFVRSPELLADYLGEDALMTPQEMFAKLGPESMLPIMQQNPPFWSPPEDVQSPMLVVAGDADQAISFGASQRTAEHYDADFMAIEGAPHNLMLEANAQDIARQVEEWLRQQGVA